MAIDSMSWKCLKTALHTCCGLVLLFTFFFATAYAETPSERGRILADSPVYQNAIAGHEAAHPPSVRIEDNSGNPVSGVTVTFSVTNASGYISDAGHQLRVYTATTDADGRASVPSWVCDARSGKQHLEAINYLYEGAPVVFHLDAQPGPAARLEFEKHPQTTPAGLPIRELTVRVLDAYGNPVGDNDTEVLLISSDSSSAPISPLRARTTSGIARFDSLTITGTGSYTLEARADGLVSALSYPFMVSAGQASAARSTFQAEDELITADGMSSTQLTVRAIDNNGNLLTVGGDRVLLRSSAGTVGRVTDHRNGLYTATLTSSAKPATAVIAAMLNGIALKDTLQVEFADRTAPFIIRVGMAAKSEPVYPVLNQLDLVVAAVTFSEPVIVSGTPQLVLTIGDRNVLASYVTSSGSADTLKFRYTILPGQHDEDGIAIPANALLLKNALIRDMAGNAAKTGHMPVLPDPAFKVDAFPPKPPVLTGTLQAGHPRAVWSWLPVTDAAVYICRFDDHQPVELPASVTSYIPDRELPPGKHTLSVHAVDSAGNQSEPSSYTLHIRK